MKNIITVNGQTLPVREYKGQRVVTVKDIATVHETDTKVIRNNFVRNKKHFIEGTDYFRVVGKKAIQETFQANSDSGSEKPSINLMPGSNSTNILLFTESGYLMLAKSLTGDLAWKVQRELVNGYFKCRVVETEKTEEMSWEEAFYKFLDKFEPLMRPKYRKIVWYRIKRGLNPEETAFFCGHSEFRQYKIEQDLKRSGIPMPKYKPKRIQLTFKKER